MSQDHNLMEIRPEHLAVLVPFMRMMANELERHNSRGSVSLWPLLDEKQVMLELHSQVGTLHHEWGMRRDNGMAEACADVANMAMIFASATGQLQHYSLPNDAELYSYLAALTRYGLANRKAIERLDLLKELLEVHLPDEAFSRLPRDFQAKLSKALQEAP